MKLSSQSPNTHQNEDEHHKSTSDKVKRNEVSEQESNDRNVSADQIYRQITQGIPNNNKGDRLNYVEPNLQPNIKVPASKKLEPINLPQNQKGRRQKLSQIQAASNQNGSEQTISRITRCPECNSLLQVKYSCTCFTAAWSLFLTLGLVCWVPCVVDACKKLQSRCQTCDKIVQIYDPSCC